MGKDNNSIDILGQKFGRWDVVGKSEIRSTGGCIMWDCICDCGNTGTIKGTELRNGLSTSCGCYKIEKATLDSTKHGAAKNRTPEYTSWGAMKSRCYDKNNDQYDDYGGRGIIVCERWLDKDNGFINFLADMGKKPTPKHSLDRFPNNETGIYEPSNCRWGTKPEQDRNKRNNRWLEYNGEKMVIIDWGKRLGVHYSNIHTRLKRGETFESIVEYYQNKNKAA